MGMIDYESLTVSTSAVGISASLLDQHVNYALVECEGAAVRYRLDGTDPTSSVGHVLEPGDVLELEHGDLSSFKAIRRDGVSATLRVSTGVRQWQG